MAVTRDVALQTVARIVNRQVPIKGGVTITAFRPLLALDGVSTALSRWATAHSYSCANVRTAKESLFEREFSTIGFTMLARKGALPPELQLGRIDDSDASCAAQLFADKVADLFVGDSQEAVADAVVLMVVRDGLAAISPARALRNLVAAQLGCGRDGMRKRVLYGNRLGTNTLTVCDIDLITREE